MKEVLPEKINLLVYGTLRPGDYNDVGLTSTAGTIVEITTPGAMFNRRGTRAMYPVVDFTMEGTVIGDLLVDLPTGTTDFMGVLAMELGAGYSLAIVDQYEYYEGVPENVYAFHFDCSNRDRGVGVRIPDGDWPNFCRQEGPWESWVTA